MSTVESPAASSPDENREASVRDDYPSDADPQPADQADDASATELDALESEYGFSVSSDRSAARTRVIRGQRSIGIPAGTPTTADPSVSVSRPGKRPRGLRRRLVASAVLMTALVCMGGTYAAFAMASGATDTGSSAADVAAGRQLYQVSCITCHGANLEGITGQGPSLVGVGAASAYFQVATGRMPAAQQGAYEPRKTAKFNDAQTRQLAAYVEAMGGGPMIPTGKLQGTDSMIANGGALFRLNCASCHGTTGKGAPLSAGKIAPSLNVATDTEIWTAMLSGPESMPVFSDNQITPSEKQSIIAYIRMLNATKDPGGSGIDRIGPVSEAIVIWTVGVGALMVAILWIGARSR